MREEQLWLARRAARTNFDKWSTKIGRLVGKMLESRKWLWCLQTNEIITFHIVFVLSFYSIFAQWLMMKGLKEKDLLLSHMR
jgi:hypothetical protein